MASLRILFIGHFLYNSGFSESLSGYVRAARAMGHDLRVSKHSLLDKVVSNRLPLADFDWKPDLLVLNFESYQYMSEATINAVEMIAPRAQRLIIDDDGKYSPPTRVNGDTNHADEESWRNWQNLYRRLADRIVQPTLRLPAAGTRQFLLFGMENHRECASAKPLPKTYDIAYIGNNWYRWQDICWFIHGLEPIRKKLGRIALYGKWWSGKPLPGVEEHTYSDPSFLHKHKIEVHRSVRFGNVKAAMGRASINLLFVRPILSALQFATPRMFETFEADTIPLLSHNFLYAETLYGDSIAQLRMGDDPAERVEFIMSHYREMRSLVRDITAKLAKKHSYKQRLAELIELFE
jgi:hypothetical protein